MPKIFDNIDLHLLPVLKEAVKKAYRADFCIGYFNLRGWKDLADAVDTWPGGDGHCARILVGMQRAPKDELRDYYRIAGSTDDLDNQAIARLKKNMALEFRNQLTQGAPTNADETALRHLAEQLRSGKVVVRLFMAHPLHAKLYLLHFQDNLNPMIGFLGSSNLTFAGLSQQGELNVDVKDDDAAQKLSRWFEDRWNDWGCVDISEELIKVIEESWARTETITPYQIYVKMAYHLSQEARSGLSEFRIPKDFGDQLLDFQVAAVKIAAHHLNRRGGVLIGDVVGLGKTLMATALARIFEDDQDLETLIICPKNLVPMWQKYHDQYRLRGRVLSSSKVTQELPNLRRYRLVILDESHNLRNREGRRYKAIQDYIQKNESKVILLSATPYNKTYLDLSSQLRLFIPEDQELPVRPENLLREIGETEFVARHQCSPRLLTAFEKSTHADDWRELMRLYMVRRTRSFIIQNYAHTDPETGRKFLLLSNNERSAFPVRKPRTLKFAVDENNPNDPYARMYADEVVDAIDELNLPRYGLANYLRKHPLQAPSPAEKQILADLSRAGKRLMGFCRTNLFKRLESSGAVFIESIERHILRNYIFLHALKNNLPLPIGTQDVGLLDTRFNDEDVDRLNFVDDPTEDEGADEMLDADIQAAAVPLHTAARTAADFEAQAAQVYQLYQEEFQKRFKWLSAGLFTEDLQQDLLQDAQDLMGVLKICGDWDWQQDAKLQTLLDLVTRQHANDKILIFTQFADTAHYLESCLKASGVTHLASACGGSADPTDLAMRFSPNSNNAGAMVTHANELRVLVSTDVLSEGQNLQDGYIVVNYDLPWAIVRLIQRAGRVDRIGQKSDQILCYSFLPAEGVEKIIRLRALVEKRLKENAEVVGADEAFFEGDNNGRAIVDIYNEKAGVLDGDEDGEVDLASYAYQIWKNAITRNPSLQRIVPDMPPVVFSSKNHIAVPNGPGGALVYVRTGQGNDMLAWVDNQGRSVTQSQFEILRAAECPDYEPALPRAENHHDLVLKAVQQITTEERSQGGNLGKPSGARFRTYERLNRFVDQNRGTLFVTQELLRAIDDIYRYGLRETAKDILNRQLRSGIQDQQLVELVVGLRAEGRLSLVTDQGTEVPEPEIVCSLGLITQS